MNAQLVAFCSRILRSRLMIVCEVHLFYSLLECIIIFHDLEFGLLGYGFGDRSKILHSWSNEVAHTLFSLQLVHCINLPLCC